MFGLAALAIVPLSGYLGKATEEIAAYTGPTLGGLLNATLGNMVALFADVMTAGQVIEACGAVASAQQAA